MLGVGCQGKARRVLTYRDLQVRQAAMDLALESYKLAVLFPRSETYGLRSQLHLKSRQADT